VFLCSWGKRAAHNRAQIIYYLAENLELRRTEFAQCLASLTGGSEEAGLCEVDLSIKRLFHWAAYADKYGGTVQVRLKKALGLIIINPVHVAVALRVGCCVCVAHTCRCGALVDAQGIHGSVCKQARSKIARHQAINDVIARAITTAGVPVTKEPVGLARLDGKRPDGLTFIP